MTAPEKQPSSTKSKSRLDSQTDSEFLDLISESTSFGFWKWDIEDNILSVSNSLKRILPSNMEAENLAIEDLWACLHPEELTEIKEDIQRCVQTRVLIDKEIRVKAINGDFYIWMQLKCRVKQNDDGQTRLGGTLIDISEAVDLKRKLQQQKTELRFIFDNVPAKIWYKDASNKILRMNQKAANSMGITVKEGEGADTYKLFPDMAKKYHTDDLRVIKTNEPLRGIVEEFIPLKGKRAWVRTDKFPYTDPISQEKTLLVMSVDITAEKFIQEELEQKRMALQSYSQKLENANKELENFAYVASHDLKAPLRSMDNLAVWIEEDLGSDITPGTAEKLALLRSRVLRLEDMLKDILAFSYAGKNVSSPEYLDVDALLDEVSNWLSPPSTITIHRAPDLPNVKMIKTMMEQIFLNLLSNAIKHNPKKNGTITIEGYAVKDGTEFIVTDNGPGIPERYHEYVFELFKTLRPRDKVAGSGIGLAIIKKMLDSIGGDIWIEVPSSGVGTAFHFLIPEVMLKGNSNAK